LQDAVATGPACKLGPDGDDDPVARRHLVEPFGNVAVNLVERAATAWAAGRIRHQQLLDMWQMSGNRRAALARFADLALSLGPVTDILLHLKERLRLGVGNLPIFQRQIILVG